MSSREEQKASLKAKREKLRLLKDRRSRLGKESTVNATNTISNVIEESKKVLGLDSDQNINDLKAEQDQKKEEVVLNNKEFEVVLIPTITTKAVQKQKG